MRQNARRPRIRPALPEDGDGRAADGTAELRQDLLAHMTDHLLEMRTLAEMGRMETLSRMLDLAYEEAYLQLVRRAGPPSSR